MAPTTITLRSKIEAAVAPYASSNASEPPFSIAEIMVMAWVCQHKPNTRFVSDEDVSDWMFTTFGYYRKMALKQVYQHSFQNCSTAVYQRNEFHRLVLQRTIQSERIDVPLKERSAGDTGGYTSTFADARRFLQRAVGDELTKFDRFFKLPVEIRILIYEELFRSRVNGLQYNDIEFDTNRNAGLRLSQRGNQTWRNFRQDWTRTATPSSRHWTERPRTGPLEVSVTERTPELLALLLVNRQIFEEAMPVFYSVNHFHVTELLELTNMLKHCGARRRPYFTSISLDYNQHEGPRTAIKAFKLLKDVKRLRHLEIDTLDTCTIGGEPLTSDGVPKLPGIKILGSVRVWELHFTGECPLTEAYLRPTMEIKGRDEDKGGKAKTGRKAKAHKSAETVVENEDDA
jgi:hypothetical protein